MVGTAGYKLEGRNTELGRQAMKNRGHMGAANGIHEPTAAASALFAQLNRCTRRRCGSLLALGPRRHSFFWLHWGRLEQQLDRPLEDLGKPEHCSECRQPAACRVSRKRLEEVLSAMAPSLHLLAHGGAAAVAVPAACPCQHSQLSTNSVGGTR